MVTNLEHWSRRRGLSPGFFLREPGSEEHFAKGAFSHLKKQISQTHLVEVSNISSCLVEFLEHIDREEPLERNNVFEGAQVEHLLRDRLWILFFHLLVLNQRDVGAGETQIELRKKTMFFCQF